MTKPKPAPKRKGAKAPGKCIVCRGVPILQHSMCGSCLAVASGQYAGATARMRQAEADAAALRERVMALTSERDSLVRTRIDRAACCDAVEQRAEAAEKRAEHELAMHRQWRENFARALRRLADATDDDDAIEVSLALRAARAALDAELTEGDMPISKPVSKSAEPPKTEGPKCDCGAATGELHDGACLAATPEPASPEPTPKLEPLNQARLGINVTCYSHKVVNCPDCRPTPNAAIRARARSGSGGGEP